MSTRLRSQVLRKLGVRFGRQQRRVTNGSRLNWEASLPLSCSKTPIWMARLKDWWTESGSTKDKCPASVVAQEEIFGPVLAAMTFRTPSEAVELANNTAYGLAACVWSESINVALHVAAQVKAGVVWVNCTNQ